MTGPCLCGDPECGRCFPRSGGRFCSGDLADLVAAYGVAAARNAPAPSLDALAPVDVAGLIELTVQAVRTKLQAGRRPILDTERELDSDLAGRIFDLIREYDLAAAVTAAER